MQTNQWTTGARTWAICHRPFFFAMLLLAALFAPATARAQGDLPPLFSTAPMVAADAGKVATFATPKGYKRARLAKLNPQMLVAETSPLRQFGVAGDAPNVSLNFFPDQELPVIISRTDFRGEGNFVAYGAVADAPQSSVILAVNGDHLAATISMPGGKMLKIVPAADGFHLAGEINPAELPNCGTPEVQAPVIGGGDVVPATAGDAVSIDVMIVYTKAARIAAGSAAAMDALVDLAVAEANTCYSNSAISISLNLVYRGEVDYTESGSANTDLTRMQSGTFSQLQSIQTLRNTYGADIVTLVTETMSTYAGLGYVMSQVSSGFAPFAFNVVKREYLTGSYVYAHEVGHNMGCQHDRGNANTAGAYAYSYGHRFDASSTTYRTVMAYAPGTRIPYFSNPDVSYLGTATGIAIGQTNAANNAASISNAAPTIASFFSTSSFYNFDETSLSVNEDDGTVTLTVNRTGTFTTNTTVGFTTAAVSATAASDYTTASGTLTFATNETSKTITVTILNNSVVENNETFKVNLVSPAGGPVLGPNSSATVTIVDDDIGVTLSAATNSVSEGGTNIVLTVNRSGGLTNTVSVDYATADVTATAGDDYTSASGTLTFTNGVTSQTVTISITDDSSIESNETFRVNLSNATGGATIVSPTNTVVTIVENDSSISFSTNAVSPGENGTLSLTVTRAGGTAGTVTVDYLTADDTATEGADYTNTNGTLTFTNGQVTKTITVPLINDSSVEGNETFTISITNATGGAVLGTYTNVTATIRDNDSVFNFSAATASSLESAGNITLNVWRTGGVIGTATVRYTATNGTATAGSDFKALTGTLSFAAGETNKTITLSPINDTAVETNETLTIGLSAPTGEATLGTNDVVTVTLEDNDSLIGWSSGTLTVAEASTNMTLTVERSGTLTLTNTIVYTFKAGSAGTSDFRGTNGVLTFAPGDTNKTITFAILEDTTVEADENFSVILSGPTGGAAITGTNTAVVTITESDSGLAFAATAYSVSEAGTNVVVTVNRTGSTNGTVSVEYATIDGGAEAGSDYTTATGTLTFTNGVTSQTITLSVTDDSTVETNETFRVTLSNPTDASILGSTNAVITILENDATIALSTNAVSVSELATNITFTVLRTGGTNSSMTVDYFTTDGTAEDGSDYTAATGTVTFAAGQKSKTITIDLTNDTSVEGDEAFSLTLTNATSGASLGAFTNVTATIRDNDSVFSVGTNAVSVAETAGTAVITVTRTGGVVGAATVAYATTNDTATAGSDYTAATGTLSFAAGETNKTFTVKITNDTSSETNETFTVGLSAPTGEGSLSTNIVTTVTITDNDSTISFETNAVTVAESAGTVSITVNRAGTLTLTNTVPYSFKARTATTADYTATNGTLTFGPGETNKTITAAIINDSLIETNETFTLTLGAPTGGALISGTNLAVITITENDAAISFAATTASVWEDETNIVLTINRTGDTTSTVTVDYATADITAASNGDYTNTSGTLTFTNGVSSLTVTIPIVEDATVESNETFALNLSNPSGAVISGATNATVTIREEDVAFTLSSTNYTGREGTNAIITLTRIGNTNTALTATLLTAYTGTATNTDFTEVNTNLTFSTGQVSLTYSIAITKDSEVDTNETFDVQIQSGDIAVSTASPTNATVTIIDNTGTIQFAASTASVVESAASVALTLSRTGGTNNTLSVDYVTADGSATNGLDYTATTNTVTFAAGQSSKTISIPLTNDTSIEGDENFTVTISNPDGAILGATTVATVTILDNDSVIQLSTNAVSIAESGGKVSVNITRTGGIAAAANVNYATTNDTATAGSDYTAATGTLKFAAGETNKVLQLTILNDTTYETNEVFNLVLSSPTGEASLGTNDTVEITITDNDSTLSWETNSVTVDEDDGTVTLTVNRTGTLTLTNTIAYAFKAGSAGASDYSGTNGVLTFAPGDTNKTITVAITNDSTVETNESFSVILSAPTGGSVIGGTNTAYITIVDNDIGIALATATRTVSEDATNIVFTVNRHGNTNGTVSVDYTFTDITATNSVDYAGTNGSLSFTNGVTTLTVEVPITNDSEIEANETFRISLSNISGASFNSYTNTVVTILEDDSSLAFTTNALSVVETATSVTLTVRRTGGTNSTVTVDYLTTDGTATDGADYTSTNATLTFSPGQVTKTFTVPLSNDSSVEGDETFTVGLTNATGTSVVLGSYTNATVTIRDNDSVFSVSTNAASVAENVGTTVVTVTRTGGVVGVASVQYATANDTATAGADYTANIKTLAFKAGETNKTIAIKITNDTDAESDETFTLTLSSPTGEATVSTNNVITLTILDNDFSTGDIPGSVAPIGIKSLRWSDSGAPILDITGPIGAYVIVDASIDLTTWEQINEQPILSGAIEVIDNGANDETATRFYRLRPPPENNVE